MSLISPIGTSSWSVTFLPGRSLTSSIGAVISLVPPLCRHSELPRGHDFFTPGCDDGAVSALETRQPPSFADVEAAARRLAGVAHRTPVVSSRILDGIVGSRVLLKAEGLQRIGAFKFRGAYDTI